ncbi:MAG: hypothetical protein AB7D33_14025, partial [Sphingobium sp.]
MNFESGFAGDSLEADQPRLRQRRHLIWIVSGALLLFIAAILYFTRGGASDASVDADAMVPRVTVVVPGRSDVSTVINAV